MYWRHRFWRKTDLSDRTSIPIEPRFDLEPSLDVERIAPFLAKGRRHQWFISLLTAVLQYPETGRPIVILDTDDHIAMWIAAVTFALPEVFRPLISFTTYHQILTNLRF